MTHPSPRLPAFVRHLAAYGASEAASKATRLLVVIAVSRGLDVATIGVAAGALATGDILKSLTQNGIGQRIMAAPFTQLSAVARTAHRLFWLASLALFVLQLGVAAGLWLLADAPTLALLVAILSLEYLFMPGGLVQAALAMRWGKMAQTARIAGTQVVVANVASALLVLVWPSGLALVLPRLLTAPYWLLAMRRLHHWTPDTSVTPAPVAPFLRFGITVLGVEIAQALRLQADKLVIGVMMGAEMLGLYFMAFNAGLGLASSFSTAFATVLFPHLATASDRTAALRQSLIVGLGLITPAVIAQALLAPIYVPILFGDGWDGISDVVSILCLAAIPGTLWSAAAGWLRVQNRAQTELVVTIAMTGALIANTAIMAPFGLTAIATGYLSLCIALMGVASWPAISAAFGTRTQEI
jgi:lipopolysaccharide exporter